MGDFDLECFAEAIEAEVNGEGGEGAGRIEGGIDAFECWGRGNDDVRWDHVSTG